jgi:hypothetical protein
MMRAATEAACSTSDGPLIAAVHVRRPIEARLAAGLQDSDRRQGRERADWNLVLVGPNLLEQRHQSATLRRG